MKRKCHTNSHSRGSIKSFDLGSFLRITIILFSYFHIKLSNLHHHTHAVWSKYDDSNNKSPLIINDNVFNMAVNVMKWTKKQQQQSNVVEQKTTQKSRKFWTIKWMLKIPFMITHDYYFVMFYVAYVIFYLI